MCRRVYCNLEVMPSNFQVKKFDLTTQCHLWAKSVEKVHLPWHSSVLRFLKVQESAIRLYWARCCYINATQSKLLISNIYETQKMMESMKSAHEEYTCLRCTDIHYHKSIISMHRVRVCQSHYMTFTFVLYESQSYKQGLKHSCATRFSYLEFSKATDNSSL